MALDGSVPIKSDDGEDAETYRLPFCIESEITKAERYLERMRTRDALMYQQGMAMLREQSAAERRSRRSYYPNCAGEWVHCLGVSNHQLVHHGLLISGCFSVDFPTALPKTTIHVATARIPGMIPIYRGLK